jgi:hypothetical protein
MQLRNLMFVAIVFVPSFLVAAENCPASPAWFATSGTPKPSTSEPKRGDDCAFYQRAWQTFLFVTQPIAGKPRFLSFPTFATVFGSDPKIGLERSRGDSRMVLAPRLRKHGERSDTQFGEDDISQAGSDTVLLDQHGRPILFNIILNPTLVAFVRSKHLNDLKTLQNADSQLEWPAGAVEMKAAWQIVDEANPPKDRIVTKAAVPRLFVDVLGFLQVDTKAPKYSATVALIGLHVVMRTRGHPEMIWATFEFDSNAPSTKGNPSHSVSNCINGAELIDETVMDDGREYVLYRRNTPVNERNRIPDTYTTVDAAKQIFDATPHISIVRIFPFSNCSLTQDSPVNEIDGAIVALNTSAKAQLKDLSRNSYSLIGAVWMDEPRNPNEDLAFSENRHFENFQLGGERRLSSTSMESFTQLDSQNCFACHDTTRKGKVEGKRINVSHVVKRFSTATAPAQPPSATPAIPPPPHQ